MISNHHHHQEQQQQNGRITRSKRLISNAIRIMVKSLRSGSKVFPMVFYIFVYLFIYFDFRFLFTVYKMMK
jgi:hypothetical protein